MEGKVANLEKKLNENSDFFREEGLKVLLSEIKKDFSEMSLKSLLYDVNYLFSFPFYNLLKHQGISDIEHHLYILI